jgi:hypothetical protein
MKTKQDPIALLKIKDHPDSKCYTCENKNNNCSTTTCKIVTNSKRSRDISPSIIKSCNGFKEIEK